MIRPFPLLVSWLAATLAVVAPASAQSDSEDNTVRVPMRVISQAKNMRVVGSSRTLGVLR